MFKFEINWNRKLAAKGWTTSAFACEMIRSHVLGNFVNVKKGKSGALGPFPSLSAIHVLRLGESLEGFHEDETGRTTWSLIRVASDGAWNKGEWN